MEYLQQKKIHSQKNLAVIIYRKPKFDLFESLAKSVN